MASAHACVQVKSLAMQTGRQQAPDVSPDRQYDLGAVALLDYVVSVAPDGSLLAELILEVMVGRRVRAVSEDIHQE